MDINDILKNAKPIKDGENNNPSPPTESVPMFVYISIMLIMVLIVNTFCYFIYDISIKPVFNLPQISWWTMLAIFMFFHTFTLKIFSIFYISR